MTSSASWPSLTRSLAGWARSWTSSHRSCARLSRCSMRWVRSLMRWSSRRLIISSMNWASMSCLTRWLQRWSHCSRTSTSLMISWVLWTGSKRRWTSWTSTSSTSLISPISPWMCSTALKKIFRRWSWPHFPCWTASPCGLAMTGPRRCTAPVGTRPLIRVRAMTACWQTPATTSS